MQDKMLRLPEVLSALAISRTTLYKLIKEGSFPAPYKLGPRMSVWSSNELDAWIEAQIIGVKNDK